MSQSNQEYMEQFTTVMNQIHVQVGSLNLNRSQIAKLNPMDKARLRTILQHLSDDLSIIERELDEIA